MMNKTKRIWLWIHNGQLMKAVFCPEEGSLTLYDEKDVVLLRRKGLSPAQMRTLETMLSTSGAKRIDGQNEPFTYL